jgi:hypothetical protein
MVNERSIGHVLEKGSVGATRLVEMDLWVKIVLPWTANPEEIRYALHDGRWAKLS